MLSRTSEERVLAQRFLDMGDVLERRGLAYGQVQDDQGRVCLRGAANIVLNGDVNDWTGGEELLSKLRPFVDDMHPVDWSNNWGRRTTSEVVDMLHRAAIATLLVDALWPGLE